MVESAPSPVARVQVMQALVARELVEGFGLPERQAAVLLGIVPSSVSQYLSGKRLGPAVARYRDDERVRRIAHRTAQRLMESSAGPRTVLEAAIGLDEVLSRAPGAGAKRSETGGKPTVRREVPRWLRARIAGEQTAVAECMRLAQRSRDELTRALFRQIASDSLRHAEIVASLAAYLDRGVSTSVPTGITRADVEHLIESERRAEAGGDAGPDLGGVMRILWDSMEADEHKHDLLLKALLASDLANGSAPAPREHTSRRPRLRGGIRTRTLRRRGT